MGDARRALPQGVDAADVYGIHAQRFGQLVHLAFDGKGSLRRAEASKCPARRGVGVHDVRVDGSVRQFVRPTEAEVQVSHHLVRGVVVRPRIEPRLRLRRGDLAVAIRTPARPDAPPMALVVANDRLLARPLHRHGPLNSSLGEAECGKRQDDLQRHVLPAAEGTADGGISHPNSFLRQRQCMRDLFAVLMHPLPGDLDVDGAIGVNPRRACFGLKICVLLVRHFVRRFDRDRSRGPTRFEVALAGAHRFVQVRSDSVVAVHERCTGSERRIEICNDAQRLPLDFNQFRSGSGLLAAFGDDESQMVGFPARHIARDRTGAAV